MANIYGERLFNHEYEHIEEAFLSAGDQSFLNSYQHELFKEMLRSEILEGLPQSEFMPNQRHIGRHLRMKVIDWMYEVMQKFGIMDRSVMFQTVELMDAYYRRCEQEKPNHDLQLTAVTCFFVAAKNIMVEPFTLHQAVTTMFYGKYTVQELLLKEQELRKIVSYKNESSNYLDYVQLLLKCLKLAFIEYLSQQKGYRATQILKSTARLFEEMDELSYELSKLALVDGFLRRYMKCYVACSLFILTLDIIIGNILNDKLNKNRYDLDHVGAMHKLLSTMIGKLFGFNKYVLFQFMGEFLKKRF